MLLTSQLIEQCQGESRTRTNLRTVSMMHDTAPRKIAMCSIRIIPCDIATSDVSPVHSHTRLLVIFMCTCGRGASGCGINLRLLIAFRFQAKDDICGRVGPAAAIAEREACFKRHGTAGS